MSLPPAQTAPQPNPGWRIATLRGVPVYLGRSWPLVAIVIIVIFAPQVASARPDLGAVAPYVVALAYALLLLVSVLAHEAAHALAALRFGHRVHRIVADLWGGHTIYQSDSNTPGRSALVAVAGPLANLALAVLGWVLMQPIPPGIPRLLVGALMYTNAFVALFNLLPGLPLDGGFIVDSLVWKLTGSRTKGLLVAGWCGRIVTILVLAWFILTPLLSGQSPSLFTILWIGLIGAFLWSGATQAIRTAKVRAVVDTVTVGQVARPLAVLPLGSTVDAVHQALAAGAHGVAVADEQGRPAALVDFSALNNVPPQAQATTPVTAVARAMPDGWVARFAPGEPVTEAMARMGSLDSPVMLVEDGAGGHRLLIAEDVEQALAAHGHA